uniref:SAGA-associated factor 11 n=1 Tax=Gossypium raimondii TaxID=29730 RepID=A0A0D2Q556_GOSRA|nr:hypothetical protein B456_006G075300 [Gossypium raimondii]
MVCSLGSGRMAVMARLLEAGSISPSIAEEVGNKKLAAQLQEADEANLLDEEDMHVFGLKPMTDPLNLVCCNACKKPVKASQYAAHAELCRSLKITEEIILELDGNTGHRKPPRKERKKSLAAYANQPTLAGDQERSEIIDADDDPTASESLVDGQIGMTSSLTMHVKPGNRLPLPDDPKTASGVKKILNSHDLYASKDSPIRTVSRSETLNVNCKLTKDLPAPLSTKMYYSQRNSRLRLALSHQYFITSTKELCSEMANRQVSKQSTMMLRDSSQGVCPLEHADNLLTKKQESSLQKPDQVLAQISEFCSSKSEVCLPSNDFSNPHPVDIIPRPQADSVGLTRSKYVPEHHAFAGNSV